FASRRRHTRFSRDWSSDVCSSDLAFVVEIEEQAKPDKPLTLTIDGHPLLVAHMRNARRFPNRFGVSLMKEHRESPRKIDLAVCAVGARMVRRMILNRGQSGKRPGNFRGFKR